MMDRLPRFCENADERGLPVEDGSLQIELNTSKPEFPSARNETLSASAEAMGNDWTHLRGTTT
jgi:hypothetical protein